MKRTPALTALGITALTALAAACSPNGGTAAGPGPTTAPAMPMTTPTPPSYDPKVDPAVFSPTVDNPLFPLPPGRRLVYHGTRDGAREVVEVTVKREQRKILGVPCVVVSDVVTSNSTLLEKTTDWYSQDSAGNVWYFGEDTAEYAGGVVTSTQGTWEAGVDGAKPGVVMWAQPRAGQAYRQEFRPGVAEDMARVLDVRAVVRVPAGVFTPALLTRDTDPLNPDRVENKSYGHGAGLIHAVRIRSQHRETIDLTRVTG